MKAEDYEVVKVIGRGAFGEVQLVGDNFICFMFWGKKTLWWVLSYQCFSSAEAGVHSFCNMGVIFIDFSKKEVVINAYIFRQVAAI